MLTNEFILKENSEANPRDMRPQDDVSRANVFRIPSSINPLGPVLMRNSLPSVYFSSIFFRLLAIYFIENALMDAS